MKTVKMNQLKNRTIQCLALLGSAGLCLQAMAQDNEKVDTGEPVPAAEQAGQRLPITVSAGGSYQFKSDIDNGGNFSLWRFRSGLGVPLRLNDQFALATSVKYQHDKYDFGGGSGPGSSPWSDINTLTAVSLLQYRMDENWMIYGGPLVRVAAESGANWGNATRGGGVAAFNYVANEALTIGGGIIVMGQIKEKALVVPMVTAKWQFADQWKLNVGITDLATAGYGAEVSWDFAPEWQLTFGGQYHKSRFRIEGSAANNDLNGIGQESAMTLSTALTWSPDKAFSVSAFVGLAVGGKVRLENSAGTELRSDKYDPTGIIGLNASYKF